MKVLKAYELTLQKLKELNEKGIEVKFKNSKGSENPETVEKYNVKERLPADKWLHVSIVCRKDTEDLNEAFTAQEELNAQNIFFDTGFGGGERDWELDWSFSTDESEQPDLNIPDEDCGCGCDVDCDMEITTVIAENGEAVFGEIAPKDCDCENDKI